MDKKLKQSHWTNCVIIYHYVKDLPTFIAYCVLFSLYRPVCPVCDRREKMNFTSMPWTTYFYRIPSAKSMKNRIPPGYITRYVDAKTKQRGLYSVTYVRKCASVTVITERTISYCTVVLQVNPPFVIILLTISSTQHSQ